jgi:hypothetical protein
MKLKKSTELGRRAKFERQLEFLEVGVGEGNPRHSVPQANALRARDVLSVCQTMVVGLSWLACVQPAFLKSDSLAVPSIRRTVALCEKGVYLLHGAHHIRVNGVAAELVRRPIWAASAEPPGD